MFDFFIVLACLFINAFFSAYEMAFVTVSKEEIDDLEDSARNVMRRINLFKRKPERTLSVIQIGITLVGAIAAAVGGTGAVESLEPYIAETYNLSRSAAEVISVTIVILPLTYFSVVLGELLPKTIALKHPQKVLLFGTGILSLIDRALSPVVTFLELSNNFLLKILHLDAINEEDESMGQSIEIGALPDYHQKFVQNLVSLKGRRVSKSMLPWDKVVSINFADSDQEVRAKLQSAPHSRFPVVDGDTLVGILNVKELRDAHKQGHLPWQGILRPAVRSTPSERVLDVFLRMQEKKNHISVVVNENEEFVGIITIQDILEEVVGDIHDTIEEGRTSKMLSNRGKISLKN
jgi:putative hemolysin